MGDKRQHAQDRDRDRAQDRYRDRAQDRYRDRARVDEMILALVRRLAIPCAAVAVLCGMLGVAGTAAAAQSRRPVHQGRPTIAGSAVAGKTLRALPGHWTGVRAFSFRWQRCNATGAARCSPIRTGAGSTSSPVKGRRYRLTALDVGHRIRVVVRGTNSHGTTATTSRVTTATTTLTGSAPDPKLFTLVPSSTDGSAPAGIPRSDAECAAAVTKTGEKRPSNTTDNNAVPPNPSAIQWGSGWHYWPKFVADRNKVTGDFTGTTDEIIQWAACKWGLDVNEARAEAWLESGWYMSTKSGCSGPEYSFGLFQIVAEDCNGHVVHGGYPYVANDTALNADYWAAWIRACFDGAFLDSQQSWQNSPAGGYGGQSMAKIVAANGEDYAMWGCVGAWFSNAWYSSGGQGYISTVQKDEQSKLWLQPNT
jgi:hypothetical protein